jgi:choline dehydrogenase
MFSDAFQWHIPTPPTGSWFTIIVDLLRPVSKPGQVKLKSTNALDEPDVNLNFLNDDLDLLALREGVRFVDDILMNGDGMKDIIGEDYPWPMPRASDAAMDKMIFERSQTGFRKWFHFRNFCNIARRVADCNKIPAEPHAFPRVSKRVLSTCR